MPAQILRYRSLWLVLGWLQVAGIIYLSLTSHPPPGPDLPNFDKIAHLGAYGLLMFWFCQIYPTWRMRTIISVSFVCMGISLEFLQGWSGVRMFEYWDMVANTAGVVLGGVMAMFVRKNFLSILESSISR